MRSTFLAVVALAGAGAGFPALAQGQDPSAIAAVLAGQGCHVSQPEVAPLLAPEGFTPEFVRATLSGWLVDGTATEDADGNLSLPAELCPPDAPVATPKSQLLAAFAQADECRLSRGALPRLQDELDMTEAQMRAVVYPMVERGEITVSPAGATLAPPLCGDATD